MTAHNAEPAALVRAFLNEVAADTRPVCLDMFAHPGGAAGRRKLAKTNIASPWYKPKVFVAIHHPRYGGPRVFAGRIPWGKHGAMSGDAMDAKCIGGYRDLRAALRGAMKYVEEHKAEASLYLDDWQESYAKGVLRADRARRRRES